MFEEGLSRIDKMGLSFMKNKDSLKETESLELLCELFGVEESEMWDHMSGRKFIPKPKMEI